MNTKVIVSGNCPRQSLKQEGRGQPPKLGFSPKQMQPWGWGPEEKEMTTSESAERIPSP